MPNTINVKENGMVFAHGSDRYNWTWGAVKAVKFQKKKRKI